MPTKNSYQNKDRILSVKVLIVKSLVKVLVVISLVKVLVVISQVKSLVVISLVKVLVMISLVKVLLVISLYVMWGGSLAALQNTDALVPCSNPASLTMKNSEDR